jgi:hypothetical protein
VTLRRSKTDQKGQGREIAVPFVANGRLCAATHVGKWLDAANITEGPVFRTFNGGKKLTENRIAPIDVARLVKRLTLAARRHWRCSNYLIGARHRSHVRPETCLRGRHAVPPRNEPQHNHASFLEALTNGEQVFFRRTFVVPELNLGDSEANYSMFVSHGGRLTIVFQALPADDPRAKRAKRAEHSSIAIATLEHTPTPHIAPLFPAICHNRFPQTDEELRATFAASRERTPWQDLKTTVLQECMPEAFQDYTRWIERSVEVVVNRVLRMLRWRFALDGPVHGPIQNPDHLEWSMDSENWHLMPYTVLRAQKRPVVFLLFDQEEHDAFQSLVDTPDLDEPVYREMHREAVELKESSPRSSLVLAVAAAEIAIKTICDELGDRPKPLLEDRHSPSALRLYRDELATLPVLNTVHGSALAPPERLLKSLDEATKDRQGLVHAGSTPLNQSSLTIILSDIRDLLLLVDYYRGFAWAFAQMTEATTDEMTINERAAWIADYGSPRLRSLAEGIDHHSVYRDERIALERPGWMWQRDVPGDAKGLRNAPERALALLAEARKSAPDAQLVLWEIELNKGAMRATIPERWNDLWHFTTNNEDTVTGLRGFVAIAEYLARVIIFGGPT